MSDPKCKRCRDTGHIQEQNDKGEYLYATGGMPIILDCPECNSPKKLDIKPHWEEGVPWCDAGCPQGIMKDESSCICKIDKMDRWFQGDDVCPHAVSHMAQWMREARVIFVKNEEMEHCDCVLCNTIRDLLANYPNPNDREGGA